MNSDSTVSNSLTPCILLADKCEMHPNGHEARLRGLVHGEAHLGETLYIITPTGNVFITTLVLIETQPGTTSQVAKNQLAFLQVSGLSPTDIIPRFSVATAIRPQQSASSDHLLENGQLLGLLMEYRHFINDRQYHNILNYTISHASFLFATYRKADSEGRMLDDSIGLNVEFPTLAMEDGKVFVPIFSDWKTLSLWKDFFEKNPSPHCVACTFQKLLTLASGYDGLVINPFGPASLVLDTASIQRLTSSEAYQKDFGEESKNRFRLTEADVDPEQKLRIDIPPEGEETTLIRNELCSMLQERPATSRAFLLIRKTETGELTYLCVVDVLIEEERALFEELARVVNPYLHDITHIEFAAATTLNISPALAEISCIFNRDKKIGVFNASLNGPLFDDEPTAPVKAKLSDEDKDITASVKEGFFRRLFRK